MARFVLKQSLGQEIENPCVGGSILPRPPKDAKTTFGWFFHLSRLSPVIFDTFLY